MALLQKLQHAPHKDLEHRRASKASSITMGEGGGGVGGRRASTIMGLAGPRTTSMTPAPQAPGPTLFGLLASKRLAKRFASRFHSRRNGGTSSSKMSLSGVASIQKEPSYRMEPHRKFSAKQVEEMLKTLLEDKMGKFRYSSKICSNMCKILGDDIKESVKQMNFDRYKIVTNVVIGQKKDQAVMTCSRCAWDEKLDSFASYTFQNEHIFCTATVFGIYTE